jgi:response regulator RpfG family c-di-GMP phosphodiesterase
LGRYRAGILAVLCVVCATTITALDLNNFAAFSSPLAIGLALTIWGAILALTAILVGTLSDERAEKIEELHEAYVGVVEVLSQYLTDADPKLNERSALGSRLAQEVADRMKLSSREIDDIRVATLLQDMESFEVTAKVIQRAIGSMSREGERQHTFHGSDLAQSLGQVLRGALPLLVEQDRFSETAEQDEGIPAFHEAPIGVHVIRTVRRYATLVCERPGRLSPLEAISILKTDFEDEHHPAVLHALEQVVLNASDEGEQSEEPEAEPELAAQEG